MVAWCLRGALRCRRPGTQGPPIRSNSEHRLSDLTIRGASRAVKAPAPARLLSARTSTCPRFQRTPPRFVPSGPGTGMCPSRIRVNFDFDSDVEVRRAVRATRRRETQRGRPTVDGQERHGTPSESVLEEDQRACVLANNLEVGVEGLDLRGSVVSRPAQPDAERMEEADDDREDEAGRRAHED
eukprot:79950-Rhodomonas_salina.1